MTQQGTWWCASLAAFDGKSKDLEPVFEEVAASYLKDSTIAFAEMDVTKNEAEDVSSFDFPRVILYRAGGHGKDTAEYKGEFETEALKAFVEENRAHHAADAESCSCLSPLSCICWIQRATKQRNRERYRRKSRRYLA